MKHSEPEIKTIVAYTPAGAARWPVSCPDVAQSIIEAMTDQKYRLEVIGDEAHLHAPPAPPPEPLPKVVRRPRGTGLRRVGTTSGQVGTTAETAKLLGGTRPDATVVSLAEYRDRRRSNRDFLSLDGGAA